MPGSRLAPNVAKQYDARTAAIVADGNVMEDLESMGFDQAKDHELQYTIDQNAIWVKSTPELTGSFVVKETSPSIPIISTMFMRDRPFDITIRLAATAADVNGRAEGDEQFQFEGDVTSQDFIQFSDCMITDWSSSDHEVDGMPTRTAEFQGVNRQDDQAETGGATLAQGQLSASEANNQA